MRRLFILVAVLVAAHTAATFLLHLALSDAIRLEGSPSFFPRAAGMVAECAFFILIWPVLYFRGEYKLLLAVITALIWAVVIAGAFLVLQTIRNRMNAQRHGPS